MKENEKLYSDFVNVESMKDRHVQVEYPEGPYGAPRNKEKPQEKK
ncbi:hypothetical protein [Metabacillus lacus]|nr:hypothetical protein [Metabacillus lacus]